MLNQQTEGDENRSLVLKAGEIYRYSHISIRTVMADMYFEAGAPKVGDIVPAFDLLSADFTRIRRDDLEATGPALLMFGSLTCPMTESAIPGLHDLYRLYGQQVRFVLVNVREAHPGASLPQAQTMEEKLMRAQKLRDMHKLPFEVAADDIDGVFHRLMSPKPNSAYLIGTDSRIAFRAHWANDTHALSLALQSIVSGSLPSPDQSRSLFRPMLRMMRDLPPVLDRAGAGAWSDMWRVLAPLAVLAKAIKFLGLARSSEDESYARPKPNDQA